jgi:general secretion pathway protein G
MSARLLKAGFTLIELLVVISIIGILATVVVANMNSARSRARDAARKSDMKNIQTALRLYYNDKGAYPATFTFGSAGSPFKSGTTIYMALVPDDPLSDQVYKYTLGADTDTFTMYACLENASDKQGIANPSCESGLAFQVTQ